MGHKPARTDPYQLVTDTIIAHLERGVVPWRCPWNRSTGRPRNFSTGREYQGVNVLLLGIQRYASPWWLTLRQAQERGGSVRKGERGSTVIKWGRHNRTVKNGDGTEDEKKTFFLKTYCVFNACQIDGILFPATEEESPVDSKERIARAEKLAREMPQPPTIIEGRSTQASYRVRADTVQMPALERFARAEDYYLTLFHELTHATGHASRLNRKSVIESDGFGGEVYSQEELVAEIGAAFLGTEADIIRDEHEQSASYLRGWLDALREPDARRWIVQAATQAGRAADYILGRSLTSPEVTSDDRPQSIVAEAFCGE